jgi:hypothetical protein
LRALAAEPHDKPKRRIEIVDRLGRVLFDMPLSSYGHSRPSRPYRHH